jgi:teichuronic acid biosynthesis glycosyltransferase TuaC
MPRDEARARIGLPEDKRLVLWAGEYFRPEKRWDIVQEAMALLKAGDPNAELVLLSGHSHDDVPVYMNAADVLLLVSDAEGSPMVVKEAMACNVPVVSTAAGDVANVIGRTEGCFVTSQEPRDVVEKLKLALAFGRRTNGREAVQDMELDEISRRIIAVYEGLVRSRGRHPASESAEEVRS